MKTVISSLVLLACAQGARASEWQYWSTWSATHDISETTQVSVSTEVYLRDGMSDDYSYNEYVGVSRRAGAGFSFQGQLYFEAAQSADGSWSGARLAVPGVSYDLSLPGRVSLKVQDRFYLRLSSPCRFDYHRPRATLTGDIGPVRLSLSDEMRMDLTGDRDSAFYRNRVYAMASMKAFESLRLGLGYLCQADRSGDSWKSFNGIQSLVAATF